MERCADCGRDKADDFDSQPDEGLCFSDEEHDHRCWVLTVARLRSRVAELERESRALDLLCGLVSEENGTVVFRVLEGGQRHCQAQLVPARGDTAGRAALELAVQLGILKKDGG